MRYGILSDIHGNLEALKAVLDQCRKQNVQGYLCLGDIVGYGANPRECLNLIRDIKAVTIAGNHDWATSGRLDARYFMDDGKAAILWTRNHITFEDIQWLNDLELVYKGKEFLIVHGSLQDPSHFHYLRNTAEAEETFVKMDRPVCFVGHTHRPDIFVYQRKNVYELAVFEIEVDLMSRYIVNVGSIGQSRDGNPMASYCIFDTDTKVIEINRVRYDFKATQLKIIEAGLPLALAKRLEIGK